MTTIVWLGLLVLFLIAEAATVTMVSVWFALGALAGLIASSLGAPLWLQILLFALISAVSLAALRPFAKKYFNNKIVKTNVDSVLGKKCYVTQDIHNVKGTGQVKLDAVPWTARSSSGEEIPKNTLVKIDRVEGVKVFVTPVSEDT